MQVPVFLSLQIFVKPPPRGTFEPSGYVTSLTKDAASQRLCGTGDSGGTAVYVLTTMGEAVGTERERVGVGETCVAMASCVDIPSRVCAADVYSALRVAAGCGVAPVTWLQARVAAAKTSKGISISIRDNGNGVPQKVIDKIFQPFFTTKPVGEGTGLGLSMSYEIITKGHGGELKVETKEGEYAEFIIILPV